MLLVRKVAFVLFLFTSVLLHGQHGAEYVVQKGDTLSGLLQVKSANKRISAIELTQQGILSVYTPDQVTAFFDTEYGLHEAHLINSDMAYVGNEERGSGGKSLQFLEVLVEGDLRLLSYKEGAYFFVQKQPKELEILEVGIRTVYVDETGRVVSQVAPKATEKRLKVDLYKGVLSSHMSSTCKAAEKAIQDVKLTKSSLLNLFEIYNTCHPLPTGSIEVSKEQKGYGINYTGLQAGYAFTQVDFYENGGMSDALVAANFMTAGSFVAGAYLDYFISKRNQKLSILLELQYQQIKTETEFFQSTTFSSFKDKYAIEIQSVKLNSFLKYKVSSGALQPILFFGITNNIALKKEFTRTRNYEASGTTSETDLTEKIKNWDIGYLAGAGFSYKRVSFSLRYELTDFFIDELNHRSKINHATIVVGYQL